MLFQPAYKRRHRRLSNFQPRTHQTYAGFMMPSLALLEMDGRAPCPAILHVVSRPPDLPSAGFPKKGGRRRGAWATWKCIPKTAFDGTMSPHWLVIDRPPRGKSQWLFSFDGCTLDIQKPSGSAAPKTVRLHITVSGYRSYSAAILWIF